MKAACRTEGFIKRRTCIAISCGALAPPPARLATCTNTGTTSAVVARNVADRHVIRGQICAYSLSITAEKLRSPA
ncbi:hypothetical protein PF005_g25877 [Phytophthora fragariae]|uniref:Uncharacterized protein n=1 Tax=Phytophthora fragariae TaxID=53985 RepID=A0A6A3VW01_9STRA|nr:hypothetical protein PF003_g3250 [Phytophthora fragariae]KAE8923145.1 hypothetical protein PF009_g26600 [Phytophthora fragariae]KAE9078449.1 hypothetical protein PF010_g23119 [Phytophthora fragariae]KAE9174388.1 hypothetical protein PF005_g25877 [Phytophthora fragariae]KAE9191336.1 hypothetical protein PF002_g24523 [Phytophthora fragariae]